jgi:hypothetical protein
MMGATNDNLEKFSKLTQKNVAGIKIFLGSSTEICWLTMKPY